MEVTRFGVVTESFLADAMIEGDYPYSASVGDRLEILSENGGFIFKAPDGQTYSTGLSVDMVLEVETHQVVVDGKSLAKVEKPKKKAKITYDNDELLLIF